MHKKQGLNVAVLIPGDIPAAFVPKKHVSPQNFYQDFSFFPYLPKKLFTLPMVRYTAHGFGCSPFHSCLEREAEYGEVGSNKNERILWGQHQ